MPIPPALLEQIGGGEAIRLYTKGADSVMMPLLHVADELPEDAKRFDGIDSAFREQMADASQNNNPIEVCTQSGREEVFQANFAALELCQKSLADYLEVKKKKV